MRLCAKLRWKGYYGARWATADDLLTDLVRADAPFTCLHTCQPWGADEDAAAPERCQPGRACFEASGKEPRSLA